MKPKEKDPNGLNPHARGAKLDGGKTMAGLLLDFGLALMEIGKVSTYGAKKYSRGGWQFVQNGTERYTDAMVRHLLLERYSDTDADSGLLHQAQTAWNALARLELSLRAKAKQRP